MTAWRYIAQRILTGEFLDYDVPLTRDDLTWALSASGSLRGTVSPDVGRLRASDGGLLLEEWGTAIYAEADGQIRWGGIVISSAFEGAAWHVEAAGFTSYPHGIPYAGDYSRIQIDPLTAFREVWRHVQSYSDGDLGVEVDDTATTPVRLGKAGIPAVDQVFLDGKWQDRVEIVPASRIIKDFSIPISSAMTASQDYLTVREFGGFSKVATPFVITIGTEKIQVGNLAAMAGEGSTATTYELQGLVRGYAGTTAAAHTRNTVARYNGTPTKKIPAVPAEPYLLSWWDAPDCGSELDKLAKETPFDFAESHTWDGDSIRHSIDLGYPRLGRRRADLSFIQGDNVIEVITPTLAGDDYANEVIGIGAGEGKKALRRTTAVRDGRLRRTAVLSVKDTKTTARLDSQIAAELRTRRQLLEITSITVRNHDNARIGSWALGDDILVQASLPWLGDVALWCRITAWNLKTEDTAVLTLARSDSFHYGG